MIMVVFSREKRRNVNNIFRSASLRDDATKRDPRQLTRKIKNALELYCKIKTDVMSRTINKDNEKVK